MCTTCGCGKLSPPTRVDTSALTFSPSVTSLRAEPQTRPGEKLHALEVELLAKNDRIARENRARFEAARTFAVNLMSSPGAGKTTLLERTLRELRQVHVDVIEGDQETARDAERIGKAMGDRGRVVQINTGAGCHLDADMIARALERFQPGEEQRVCVIENVGNLVCPALFDLGEAKRVVLFAVTEGEDKPLKYPHMFRAADLVVFSKIDLLPHVPFDEKDALACVREVNPRARVLRLSATTGEGFAEWLAFLEGGLHGGRDEA